MIGIYKDQRLAELIDAYDSGLYQKQEVISVCIDLLADEATRDDLWLQLPDWISSAIQHRLANFDQSEELVTFGRADPAAVKNEMIRLKQWIQASQRK
ncbi:hypothetical protein [Dyella tabacisoli]|uniref:Uncharacterized protein n=1 Tax=Dyella tabacisoli TaxID=2282381 RepID=A0A369UJ79_9GAMM|nr:hypothetical protein [Dyella tabacisoli]RDD79778.1 hypothetical protein DVJ77_20595 [Dyella tabacisoli]